MSENEKDEAVNLALIKRIEAELQRLRTMELQMARMESTQERQGEELGRVLKTLHHGNGVDPLLTRVGRLEAVNETLVEKVDENVDALKGVQHTIESNQQERRRMRTTLLSNALMAAASVVAASIAAYAAIRTGNIGDR